MGYFKIFLPIRVTRFWGKSSNWVAGLLGCYTIPSASSAVTGGVTESPGEPTNQDGSAEEERENGDDSADGGGYDSDGGQALGSSLARDCREKIAAVEVCFVEIPDES